MIFSSKRPMSSGERSGRALRSRSLECGERQPRWSEKLLRADVAGADDIESGQIVCVMVRKRDASSVEHLEKEILN
jgi:hypothetical protein